MIFIDSNIPMYAAGDDSPQKEASLNFLEKVSSGKVDATSSAEVLQEILHRYKAINRWSEGMEVYDLFRALPLLWLEVSPHDVDEARQLLDHHSHLSSREALHVAVMKRNRIEQVVTYDRGFLGLPRVTVFLPDQVG